jgi:MoaA/NifB/PqqE/SkfB family radical SAM enzyme
MVNLISPMAIGNLKGRRRVLFTEKERKVIYSLKDFYWSMFGYSVGIFPDWEILQGGCLAARERTYINPYGDIYPCNFMPKRYGNILTDDLKQVIADMQKDVGKKPDRCPATNSSFANLRKLVAGTKAKM